MARLPYAARTLVRQVLEHKPKANYEVHGDPDGLNVNRTIKFDKTVSKWLAPIVEALDDERIAEVELTEAGYLHVTFTEETIADQRTPFNLDDAITVAKDQSKD